MSPCVAVPYHLLAHSQATRASVWAVRHLPRPWESFCIYRVCESRGGKDLQGQLSCLSSPLLLCAKSGSDWWLLLKTPSTSFQKPPCRSLIPGTLIYAGGQECARRAPWLSCLVENLVQTAVTSQWALTEDPHCPTRHLTSLLGLVGITGRKALHLDPSSAWLAD